MNTSVVRRNTICMISSSGGHYEQLRMLQLLEEKYRLIWVTEKTNYASTADYYLIQTGLTDSKMLLQMLRNIRRTLKIWIKEKPAIVITTGTMIAFPMCLLAKLLRKPVIYIETFARVHDGTRAGKLAYRFADLFIYQWKSLEAVYPKGVYGGSIY